MFMYSLGFKSCWLAKKSSLSVIGEFVGEICGVTYFVQYLSILDLSLILGEGGIIFIIFLLEKLNSQFDGLISWTIKLIFVLGKSSGLLVPYNKF